MKMIRYPIRHIESVKRFNNTYLVRFTIHTDHVTYSTYFVRAELTPIPGGQELTVKEMTVDGVDFNVENWRSEEHRNANDVLSYIIMHQGGGDFFNTASHS